MSMPAQTTKLFASILLPVEKHYAAPDGSLIRELLHLEHRGGMAHCILPVGGVSTAVAHKTVDEIWFCVSGLGQIWRSQPDHEEVSDIRPGACLTIPLGTQFQFRNTGSESLCLLIATMPPRPGPEEAVPANGHWQASSKANG
jgi:mannose-6-phosphate isomerase-like protein (cupin superfamily)